MDFITQYTLWTTAQAKAASVNGLTVTINDVENTVECTAAGQVFYSSTDTQSLTPNLNGASLPCLELTA
jgi:hypothetical protein